MMTKPFKAKSKVEEREDALVISIPTPKIWFTMIFVPIWLLGWLYGLVMVSGSLLSDGAFGQNRAFLLVWLLFWLGGGLFLIFALFRMFFGREIVTITAADTQIRSELLGFGSSKLYDQQHIKMLRSSSGSISPFSLGANMVWYGFLPGSIAFDYGARTIRFAAGLDEAEAGALVTRISERFPEIISTIKDNSRFIPS